jgi:two-component system response regulator DevR
MTDAVAGIRVLVVDDHEMFLERIARVLANESDIEVVATAATMADAVRQAVDTQPDVAIVDYGLPDGDGAEAATAIRGVSAETKVLIVTGNTDERALIAAIDAGCSGFVTKDKAVRELVDAVRMANAGEAYIAPQMLASLLPRFGRTHRRIGSDLTRRELDVLELMAAGLSNQAIGDRLFVSVHTIRNHVQNILYKLSAHSKLEAVAIATREGLLQTPR